MAPTTSNGHVRKRQYQPSIASYLNRDAGLSTSSQPERATSPLSPPLPAETQASLLSVGMRVRKSVPEGYKTHKTIEARGFPFPSTAPLSSALSTQTSGSGGSSRELTPFCGLHKTGGWAAQEIPPSSAPAAIRTDAAALPGLTMSQSTIQSTQTSFKSDMSSAAGSSRKRTYEEEIEDDLDAYFDNNDEVTEQAATSLPRSARTMARVKPSLRKAATDVSRQAAGDDDFDEAAFLVPPNGMDLDEA